MTDIVDKKTRSRMMSGIRGKNTRPEMLIRTALSARGFRYRLHDSRLPGKPDLVFPKYGAVILIHGCFWHQHGCQLFKWPKSNKAFWREKLSLNRQVDRRNYKKLKNEGWYILTIWECALKGRGKLPFDSLMDQVERWLVSGTRNKTIRGRKAT